MALCDLPPPGHLLAIGLRPELQPLLKKLLGLLAGQRKRMQPWCACSTRGGEARCRYTAYGRNDGEATSSPTAHSRWAWEADPHVMQGACTSRTRQQRSHNLVPTTASSARSCLRSCISNARRSIAPSPRLNFKRPESR